MFTTYHIFPLHSYTPTLNYNAMNASDTDRQDFLSLRDICLSPTRLTLSLPSQHPQRPTASPFIAKALSSHFCRAWLGGRLISYRAVVAPPLRFLFLLLLLLTPNNNTTPSQCINHQLHHQAHLSHHAHLLTRICCPSTACAVRLVRLFTSPTHMFTLAYHHTQASWSTSKRRKKKSHRALRWYQLDVTSYRFITG